MSLQMHLMKQLIDAVPDNGAYVVVMRRDIGSYLRKGVRERRGFHLSKKCKFIVIRSLNDCLKLYGVTMPILLDYSFVHFAKQDVQDEVSSLIDNVRRRLSLKDWNGRLNA